jgi:hypothetical protein
VRADEEEMKRTAAGGPKPANGDADGSLARPVTADRDRV